MPEAQARTKAESEHRALLPDGVATPGVHLQVLEDRGSAVGSVWVARRTPPGEGAYVFDVGSPRSTAAGATAVR